MKALTFLESTVWCRGHSIAVQPNGNPVMHPAGFHAARFESPPELRRVAWFSRAVEEMLRPWDEILFWVTAWGIWDSSENWPLLYRLRLSFGEQRLLADAPGQLFSMDESVDLCSFLQLGLTAGWDIYLLPAAGRRKVFVSHDGWIQLEMNDPVELEKHKQDFADSNVKVLPPRS